MAWKIGWGGSLPGVGAGWVPGLDEPHFESRQPVAWRLFPEDAARQRAMRPTPNKAIRHARLVGTGVPAGAWPAVFPEKPAGLLDLSAPNYTCDRSPDSSVITCDRVDAAQVSDSAVPTASRSDGSARGGWQAWQDFQGCRGCDVKRQIKSSIIKLLLSKLVDYGR